MLPISLEDGPIYGSVLARYDKANGWWQDVPICSISYTALSSRWSVKPCMGEDNSLGFYVPAGTNGGEVHEAAHKIVEVYPPALLKGKGWLCIELISVAAKNGFVATSISNYGADNWLTYVDVALNGPIATRRYVCQVGTKFHIEVAGDIIHPTDSVKSHDGDQYVSLEWVVYVVKDLEVAKKWAYHENDYANLTTKDTLDNPIVVKGRAASVPDKNELVLYKMGPSGAGGAWLPSTTVWSQWSTSKINDTWMTRTRKCAPLATTCPLFEVNGYHNAKCTPVPQQRPCVSLEPYAPLEEDDEVVGENLGGSHEEPPPMLGEDVLMKAGTPGRRRMLDSDREAPESSTAICSCVLR